MEYINVENICKTYKKNEIIKNINFSLKKGEIASFIGKSGAGKTTLFNILAGFEDADSGKIFIDEKDKTNLKKDISYMTQKHLLLPYLTVLDNVCLYFKINNMDKKMAYKIAEPMLKKFGLYEYKNKYPKQLSGGMKQRVSFLRAYLKNSSLMLFDEPFSALDSITKRDIYQWFIKMIKDETKTIIFITHDINEAIYLSDRVFVISKKPANIVKNIEIDKNIKNKKQFLYGEKYRKYYDEIIESL